MKNNNRYFSMALIILFMPFIFLAQSPIHKKISINTTNKKVLKQLDNLGIDLTCGAIITKNKLTLELDEYNIEKLDNLGISYTILIKDLSKFYSDRAVKDLPKARAELKQMQSLSAQNSFSINEIIDNVGQHTECNEIDWAVPANFNLNPNSAPNSFGGCLTYDMVLQELDDMRSLYPNLISVKENASPSNQKTVEGRTVYVVRISDNPDVDENEPETLYQSLIHSRESATVMGLMYYMWYILENYNSDPGIRNLVNNQELYFIPVFNPDGFEYNRIQNPNGGGLQRKNRNTSAAGTCSQFSDGIDLNRNSAYYWGNGGASSSSCSETYRGTVPFSENETQIMRDFFLQHDFKLALNHHSFKNSMFHAYAGTTIPNPRPDEYSKYNHDMTYYNRYAHGPSTSISALNSGNMNDWMLGGTAGVSASGTPTGIGSGKKTLAWTPENGLSSEAPTSGFWPFPSNFVPIAKRAMRMNFLAAYYSGKYAKLHDMNEAGISQTSGNLNFAIENLGQTASNFTLTVTPVSSNILSISNAVTETGMTVLQQRNIAINYNLDPSINPEDIIEYKVVLTNDYATDNVLYEATIKKTYTPAIVFEDNPDVNNLNNWTSSGGSWFVTSDAYSGTNAITSTNSGSYANNESKTLQINGSLDLSAASSTIIQYYAKWDLERSFDYVQLEGSIDGTNWTPLCGKLTKPGAPNANNTYSQKTNASNNFQPDGQPLYDGDTQDKWNLEEVIIDDTNNSSLQNQSTVFLRFEFKTEASNRKDSYANANFEGFTFDDFKIYSVEIPCNALNTFPYTENFNTGIGAWTQAGGDDGNWTLNNSGTPSNGTGPANDFNGGGNYFYTEASNNGLGFNATVNLVSPCFNLTGYNNASFSFYYHMFGTSIGSLSTEVSTDNGKTWRILNTIAGQQQTSNADAWKQQIIDLSAYNGQVIKLRLAGTTGTSWSSDISIDEINLSATPIPSGPIASCKDITVTLDANGNANITDADINDGNSSGTLSVDLTTFNCTNIGTPVTVTLYATDGTITETCTAVVTIQDKTNPRPDVTSLTDVTSNTPVNSLPVPTATDNCQGSINGITTTLFPITNAGTTTVIWSYTDASNNTITQTQNVILPDTTNPTAPTNLVAANTTQNITNLSWTAASDDVAVVSYDVIQDGIVIAMVATPNYQVTGLSLNTTYAFTIIAKDAAGNASTNSNTITVTTLDVASGCTGGITTFPYAESFENTLGAWTQSSNDDINWTIDNAGTPSNGTGPTTANNGTYYMYVEASGDGTGFPNKRAILNSPCFDLSNTINPNFNFKYHMFGAANFGSIDLEISNDNGATWNSIWNLSGNQGNSWFTANVDLSSYIGSSIQLRFNRVTGATWQADFALDAINLTNSTMTPPTGGCQNGITTFPYTENFENTLGDWSQDTNDDIDWTIYSAGTPSSNTGPTAASNGTYYIYVEASGEDTGFPNKRAVLNSPCIDLANESNATFNFDYHMFGAANFGSIALEVSPDNGVTWTSIWSLTGNQGNNWLSANVDLAAYNGQSILLRFNRITGATWQADFALDVVNLITSTTIRTITETKDINTRSLELKLYPNPVTNGTLNISTLSKDLEYSIYNMVGQLIVKGQLDSKTINVSNLEATVYIIEFSNENQTITKRFIKE